MLANVHQFDPKALNNADVQEEVPAADRRLGTGCCIAAKGAIPYLLLAPGLAWLRVFFVLPMWYLAKTSLSEGLFPLFTFGWAWGNFNDAVSTVPDAVHPLGRVRGDRDRARARWSATRSRTGSRSAAAAGRTCSCCS